ncbi:hypothetical protein QP127_24285, partial [Citrobacter freundii]
GVSIGFEPGDECGELVDNVSGQVRGWHVKDDQRRVVAHGDGAGHALHLPTRQLCDAGFQLVGDT